MANAQYQIFLIHPRTGGVIDVIHPAETFNVKFSNDIRDVGKFAMTLPPTRDWLSDIPLDTQVEIYRESRLGDLESLGVWLVRSHDRFRSGNSERFIIGGYHANHLLMRRLVDPDDDSTASGGYSTKAGFAADVIREYARQQAGDLASTARQFPNFSIPAPTDFGETVGATLRFENLLKEIQKLAMRADIDFEIRRDTTTGGNALEMFIGILGEDRTVQTNQFPPYLVFNPDLGNISDPRLTVDRRNEATIAYALGDGEGVNRTVLRVNSGRENDSPYNRIEVKVDSRTADKSNALALFTEAISRLDELKPEQTFDFEVIEGVAGARYKDDWDFGDKLTVKWDDYQASLRIVSIDIELEGITETVKPEVAFL